MRGLSMVLELDDARFVVIDFDWNAEAGFGNGDRVSVRSNQYDGHGMLAKSWSLLQHAVDPGGPPPDAPIMQAIADPVLQQARETEARMDRALPDFLCQEMVARFRERSGKRAFRRSLL